VSSLRRAIDGAVFAVTFLTIVPLETREGRGAAAAPAWFGLVGLLIGAIAAGTYAAADPWLGSGVAAALAATALVVVTGGLHHDGLADCADAIGVRGGRGRRLEVMREPAIGTYGALALVLWGLTLTASLAALTPAEAAWALMAAASAGRFAALLHAIAAPPARADGLGAAFVPSGPAVLVTGATAAVVAVLAGGQRAVAVILVAALAATLVSAWARRSLGGRTGDTLGAAVVLTEVAVVLALLGSGQSP
jgi:adenosylcobinamide-GDP ribazoletransferase